VEFGWEGLEDKSTKFQFEFEYDLIKYQVTAEDLSIESSIRETREREKEIRKKKQTFKDELKAASENFKKAQGL
jgi:hypothetical protein